MVGRVLNDLEARLLEEMWRSRDEIWRGLKRIEKRPRSWWLRHVFALFGSIWLSGMMSCLIFGREINLVIPERDHLAFVGNIKSVI